jgi:hypothetical protein
MAGTEFVIPLLVCERSNHRFVFFALFAVKSLLFFGCGVAALSSLWLDFSSFFFLQGSPFGLQ